MLVCGLVAALGCAKSEPTALPDVTLSTGSTTFEGDLPGDGNAGNASNAGDTSVTGNTSDNSGNPQDAASPALGSCSVGHANTFLTPLTDGYSADPMMVTHGGNYYLYVDDQLGFNRLRVSSSIGGLASAQSQVVYRPSAGEQVGAGVSCGYIFPWQQRWYQYCGDATGNLVLASEANDPQGPYHLAGRLDAPPNYTGYAQWPIQVGSQIYMLITINGMGRVYNSIWAAKFSDPVTRSSPWGKICEPTGGAGSWECANGRCIDEGGSAVVHGNKVFLAFSAGGYESPDYCVGLMSADVAADLTQMSSWTKAPGCAVASNPGASAYGPGSLLFFKSPDGAQDWAALHAKSTSVVATSGDDRYLMAMPVGWDTQGHPVFPAPVAQNTRQPLPAGDPGLVLSAPGAYALDGDQVRLFALSPKSDDIWQTDVDPANNFHSSGWAASGAPPPRPASLGPTAMAQSTGQRRLVVTSGAIAYTLEQMPDPSGGWQALAAPFPGQCGGGPCAAAAVGGRMGAAFWGTQRAMLYTVAMDHSVYELIGDPTHGWGQWENNPGGPSVSAIGAVAATARTLTTIDLFVRGADGQLYTAYWNGSVWHSWTNFGSVPSGNASSPALSSEGVADLQVFERGQDGNIYQQGWNGSSWAGSWTAWGGPPGGAVADPTAVATPGRTAVFVRAANGQIYGSTGGQTWTSVCAP